jgi:ELWxxDGT repeat protein
MRASHPGTHIERLEPRRLLSLSLVGDFNTITRHSSATGPVVIGSVGYMLADDGVHGRELWRTDGTAAGTTLVADVRPGPDGGGFDLQQAGGLLYFASGESDGIINVWRSDGTAQGTFKLTELSEPNSQFHIGNVIDLNGTAVFGSHRFGVWRSDGTATGTVRIAPVAASGVARLNDHVYFVGAPLNGGPVALWKSDGTVAGTSVVRDFASSWGSAIVEVGGRVYFWADDGERGRGVEPWSSDGTAAGTVPIGDLVPGKDGSAPASFGILNNAVYFTAITTHDAQGRYKLGLFRTDGAAESATHIAEIGIGASPPPRPGRLVDFDGALYFSGSEASNNGALWRSDGTTQGTAPFTDLIARGSLAVFDGRLYFKAWTAQHGVEVYSTDGTVAGTRLLKDIAPGSAGIDYSWGTTPVVLNDRLLFRADDKVNGDELWSTDGTADGTSLLRDINLTTNDFFPTSLQPTVFAPGPGGSHYFVADDGVRGGALWKTDGTAAGTSFIKSFLIIPPWGIGPFAYVNGLLLFGAYDPLGTSGTGTGFELWRSDGTAAGTYLVKDIAPGTSSGFGKQIITVGNRVFFRGSTEPGNSSRSGLWVSDGTEAGTRQVLGRTDGIDFGLFSGGSLGGRLIFHANIYPGPDWTGGSIFISDGTPDGTRLVKEGFRDPGAGNWTEYNGRAYFTAHTAAEGEELWSTDGTGDGTGMIADLVHGVGGSSPRQLVATPGALYITASDPEHGRELWVVSNRRVSPKRLTALDADVQDVHASAAGGVIFTTADYGLYRFDGAQLIALSTSGFTAEPVLLGADGALNYFTARTSDAGQELWRTDGTPFGTVMVHDLLPGPGGSFPQGFAVTDRGILVSASVPSVRRELFILPPAARPAGGSLALDRMQAATSARVIDLVDDALATDPLGGIA